MHTIQKDILKMLNKKARTYSELYKTLNVRSNLFDYHLQKLQQQNLILKSKGKYKLSSIGQSFSPYLETEKQPIVAVVLAVFKDNKIVLVKREKHAYHNYWAIPGGKLRFGETFEQAAARICSKETGLDVKSAKYLATVQELVRENAADKHHFILLLYKLNAQGTLKNGKLFSLASLPKKIVPSDLHMLKITRIKMATSIIK
ncbi:MAG: NUDIX domain-containing protein, partial [DPANN group archaeon]|nr:NUDIX domain-containing protein [DPANN group archaeon]